MQETSVKSYAELKASGAAKSLRLEVYRALKTNGSLTQGELWSGFFPQEQRHTIAPRVAELVKRGVARSDGKRSCRYSGKICLTWVIIPEVPYE